MDFSVLMSVYKNERADYFVSAVDSVINQTVKPNEIILIRDGIVPQDLQDAIDNYLSNYPELFTYVPLQENGGLGNALRIGVEKSRNELIARMDTDDICVQDRFEKQINHFVSDPDLDILGGNIAEFNISPEEIISFRCVPSTHLEITKHIKNKNPFNHQTVMFKKSSVLKAGNYEHFYLFEDWYLWIRMHLCGCKFANLNEVLCKVRVTDMANRRGGLKYFRSCKKLLKYMRKKKVISFTKYLKSLTVRFVGYVLCPNFVRSWAYKKFLRKKQV